MAAPKPAHSGIGVVREVVRGAEDGQRTVAEELVHVPTTRLRGLRP
jgi:hypothetical protein